MITRPNKDNITAVVLAGGMGRRVAEQDKGLLTFQGKKMVEHVLDTLAGQTNNILIVANRNIDTYQAFGYPVISDRVKGYLGPLAGIDAAFAHTNSAYLACIACDSPLIPNDLLARMINAATGNNPLVIATDGERLHPVINLVSRSLWPDIEQRLARQQLKLMDWVESAGYDKADFSTDPKTLSNINTLEQLN